MASRHDYRTYTVSLAENVDDEVLYELKVTRDAKVDRVLEVYGDPVPDPSARYEWRYASVRTVTESETIAPLAFPTLSIVVADLLP